MKERGLLLNSVVPNSVSITPLDWKADTAAAEGGEPLKLTQPRRVIKLPHHYTHARTRAHTHTNPKSLVLHVYLRAPHREGVQPQSIFKCCGDIWKGC